jgi:hypothetical protein
MDSEDKRVPKFVSAKEYVESEREKGEQVACGCCKAIGVKLYRVIHVTMGETLLYAPCGNCNSWVPFRLQPFATYVGEKYCLSCCRVKAERSKVELYFGESSGDVILTF